MVAGPNSVESRHPKHGGQSFTWPARSLMETVHLQICRTFALRTPERSCEQHCFVVRVELVAPRRAFTVEDRDRVSALSDGALASAIGRSRFWRPPCAADLRPRVPRPRPGGLASGHLRCENLSLRRSHCRVVDAVILVLEILWYF